MKKYLLLFFLVCISSYKAQVGIGTTIPNSKSVLDIESTTRGVLMPRLTTSERDAINPEASANPNGVDGLLIYNIDTDCYNYWNRATLSWVSMCQTATTCDPSTWSELDINCGQFPAADTNIYNIGTATTGFTINISVNVSKIGPYAVSIVSNNGVTYSTTGTFTATGVQTITLTSNGGAPTSSPINFSVKANGATVCNYTKPATTTFTYSTACTPTTPALSSFNFTQGSAASGTFTIPLSVSGTGNIPSFTGTQSGITLTTAAITGATNSNTSLTVTISGTPTASGAITIPLTINGTPCSYTFTATVSAGLASINCAGATTSGTLTNNTAASGVTTSVPYTSGNGGSYPAQSIASTGVTGLTATLAAGNFNTGSGNLIFSITGTPTSAGTASFAINMGGSTCTFTVSVDPNNATFTSNCSLVVNPVYYNNDVKYFREGTSLTSSDNITISVNVTKLGDYTISTTFKGMTFSKTGTFSSLGNQNVVLEGSGTPNDNGVYENQSLVFTSTSTSTFNCTANIYILTMRNYQSNTANGNNILMDKDRGTTFNTKYGSGSTGSVYASTDKAFLANNELLSLDISGKSAYANWYNIFYVNASDKASDIQFDSWSTDATYLDVLSPINNKLVSSVGVNSRIGSVDPYQSAIYGGTSTTADAGAYAGYNGAYTPERIFGNVSIKYNGIWYNYRVVFDSRTVASTNSYFKGKLEFYSASIPTGSIPNTGPQDGTASGTAIAFP